MICGIVQCGARQLVNGKVRPFCLAHEMEFQASPEGKHLRPSSEPDFRDRLWKERCNQIEADKRAAAEAEAGKP
jgi:hypothetical protein